MDEVSHFFHSNQMSPGDSQKHYQNLVSKFTSRSFQGSKFEIFDKDTELPF